MAVVKRLRGTRRPGVELSVVTDHSRADRLTLLRLLNEVLASEVVCMLRDRRHHFIARTLAAPRIAHEFLVHADEDLAHADLIAERLVQLGGEPDFAPDTLQARSHAQFVAATSIVEMVQENLVAERVAIERYHGLLQHLGKNDPTTRRMLEGILSVKAAHADELLDLLQSDPRPG
jgi:bacterioferritin